MKINMKRENLNCVYLFNFLKFEYVLLCAYPFPNMNILYSSFVYWIFLVILQLIFMRFIILKYLHLGSNRLVTNVDL